MRLIGRNDGAVAALVAVGLACQEVEESSRLPASPIGLLNDETNPRPKRVPAAPISSVQLTGNFGGGGLEADSAMVRNMLLDVAGLPNVGPVTDLDGMPFALYDFINYKCDRLDSDLRKAVREAIAVLKEDDIVVQVKILTPPMDSAAEQEFKERIAGIREEVSAVERRLEEVWLRLGLLAGDHGQESRRWQANHDFVTARLLGRLVVLREYNAQLGKLIDGFPPRDPSLHVGCRLTACAASGPENELLIELRDGFLERLIEEHRRTPFAVLAKREGEVRLGLDWVPLAK